MGKLLKRAWKEDWPLIVAEIAFAITAILIGRALESITAKVFVAIAVFLAFNLGLILLGIWFASEEEQQFGPFLLHNPGLKEAGWRMSWGRKGRQNR